MPYSSHCLLPMSSLHVCAPRTVGVPFYAHSWLLKAVGRWLDNYRLLFKGFTQLLSYKKIVLCLAALDGHHKWRSYWLEFGNGRLWRACRWANSVKMKMFSAGTWLPWDKVSASTVYQQYWGGFLPIKPCRWIENDDSLISASVWSTHSLGSALAA